MTRFEDLNEEVKASVKRMLRAYNESHVTFYNGEYHVSAGVALLAKYPSDYKVIGDYKAKDIYTDEERIVNYVNEFKEYPIEYKGDKDWEMMAKMRNDAMMRVKMENGNIVRA